MSVADPARRPSGVFAYWPNRITAIRFVGSLVLFAIFAIWGDLTPEQIETRRLPFLIAFWLFVVVAATDYLDGYLARRDKHITAFGRIADPFTDKVLILGTMVYLADMPWSEPFMPATVVVVIVAREFLVTAVRGLAESQGIAFPADRLGKTKMIAQAFTAGALITLVAGTTFWRWLAAVGIWVSLALTLWSGANYVWKARHLLRAS